MNRYLTKELLAALGVIASLLFVAFEIEQNTRVARAEARNELAAANGEWLLTLSTNSEVRDLWRSVWASGDITFKNLSESELSQFRYLVNHNMRRFENVYFHYAEGLVDESALGSYGLQNSDRYQSKIFSDMWSRLKEAYDPEFVSFFERYVGIES